MKKNTLRILCCLVCAVMLFCCAGTAVFAEEEPLIEGEIITEEPTVERPSIFEEVAGDDAVDVPVTDSEEPAAEDSADDVPVADSADSSDLDLSLDSFGLSGLFTQIASVLKSVLSQVWAVVRGLLNQLIGLIKGLIK